jgi:hypothetical protein
VESRCNIGHLVIHGEKTHIFDSVFFGSNLFPFLLQLSCFKEEDWSVIAGRN